MNQRELKQQATLKKKVGCILTDCGQFFTFTISEHVLALSEQNKRTYTGKCTRCHKHVKLRDSQRNSFASVYGSPNYVVSTSTFNALFEPDEK
jgi:hypothetical protein